MAERMYVGSAGTLKFDENNKPYVIANEGKIGNVLYGPYERYVEKGKYEVTFAILIDNLFTKDGRNFCHVDVVHSVGKEHAVISRAAINSNAEIKDGVMSVTLPFVVEAPGILQYRLHSLGTHLFGVKYHTKVSLPGQKSGHEDYGEFYTEHEDRFRRYLLLGAKIISALDDGVVIEWRGIKLLVNNEEDFVLINEILNLNSYNFLMPADVCVIDVGMNVGIASLYMASLQQVRAVHSFEPFSRPFARALKNFSLNPELSAKISPQRAGIAGANEILEVTVSENRTIGTSIRGNIHGNVVDRITIQEGSEALGPLIIEANHKNQAVVVKLDCEGCEFPILESLNENHLLQKVNAFMIECHKEWSPGKDNHTVGKLLYDNGFCVFDFNHMDNVAAANMYACRVPNSR